MKLKFLIFVFLFFALPVFATDKIDINSATLSELDELTGIGPKYAQAIIDNRPYSSVDDLLKVKGIGEKTLAKIKEQGIACVNCAEVVVAENKTENKIEQPEKIITYPKILINEILPNPRGADETEEYIKLYNPNNFEVDLTGWKLQNTSGTITTYTISQKILANNYLIFKRPETKITLHNDGDGVILQTPDGKIADSVNFGKAPLGWIWGKTNIAKASTASISESISEEILPKSEKSVKNNIESQNTNPWFLFFTALAITFILALVVLIIKLKFQKNVRT